MSRNATITPRKNSRFQRDKPKKEPKTELNMTRRGVLWKRRAGEKEISLVDERGCRTYSASQGVLHGLRSQKITDGTFVEAKVRRNVIEELKPIEFEGKVQKWAERYAFLSTPILPQIKLKGDKYRAVAECRIIDNPPQALSNVWFNPTSVPFPVRNEQSVYFSVCVTLKKIKRTRNPPYLDVHAIKIRVKDENGAKPSGASGKASARGRPSPKKKQVTIEEPQSPLVKNEEAKPEKGLARWIVGRMGEKKAKLLGTPSYETKGPPKLPKASIRKSQSATDLRHQQPKKIMRLRGGTLTTTPALQKHLEREAQKLKQDQVFSPRTLPPPVVKSPRMKAVQSAHVLGASSPPQRAMRDPLENFNLDRRNRLLPASGVVQRNGVERPLSMSHRALRSTTNLLPAGPPGSSAGAPLFAAGGPGAQGRRYSPPDLPKSSPWRGPRVGGGVGWIGKSGSLPNLSRAGYDYDRRSPDVAFSGALFNRNRSGGNSPSFRKFRLTDSPRTEVSTEEALHSLADGSHLEPSWIDGGVPDHAYTHAGGRSAFSYRPPSMPNLREFQSGDGYADPMPDDRPFGSRFERAHSAPRLYGLQENVKAKFRDRDLGGIFEGLELGPNGRFSATADESPWTGAHLLGASDPRSG